MAQPSRISAAGSRFYLDVYVIKCYYAARKFAFRNCHKDSIFTVRSLFVSLPFEEAGTQRPDIGQIASREHSRCRLYQC
jgi:hypothetical protein